ncbi:MAG TPA: NAD(P)/FAD-dependent oxidoreductase [Candidatus Saccharimonadales bacterium]|nr:NAD(P)/FAD-dependent oxidoreductase [Candidatus Saccharimonadales bacterium]
MSARRPGQISTVAILGAGPAASTLAILLTRAGRRVAILHRPRTAPLLVGESLVPAIILMLRKLGVEDEVAGYSQYKPGACFNIDEQSDFPFAFKDFCGSFPPYAYNVPRIQFEATLLDAARKAGAKVVDAAAGVERVEGTDQVRLNRETLDALGGVFPGTPDLIVDASGRVRLLPKLLDIPSHEGGRKDTALFAHVDKTQLYHEGYVHSTRLDHGWSWRIPLPGRVSVGVVIGSEHLSKFGTTKEERYDNLLREDSMLRKVAGGAKRLTPVMEYTNYQLVSGRMFGEGWALVGDTAGFIDPVFSSGLFIAMNSAFALASAICGSTPEAFQRYEKEVTHHLKIWREIVGYFYDGRLFTSFSVGKKLRNNLVIRLAFPHINKHMGRIFLGAASTSPYSIRLLRLLVQHGLRNEDPKNMAVR